MGGTFRGQHVFLTDLCCPLWPPHPHWSDRSVLLSDRSGLENVNSVEALQETLIRALRSLITRNHPNESAIFTKLLLKLPDLRSLNNVHSEQLLAFKVHSWRLPSDQNQTDLWSTIAPTFTALSTPPSREGRGGAFLNCRARWYVAAVQMLEALFCGLLSFSAICDTFFFLLELQENVCGGVDECVHASSYLFLFFANVTQCHALAQASATPPSLLKENCT